MMKRMLVIGTSIILFAWVMDVPAQDTLTVNIDSLHVLQIDEPIPDEATSTAIDIPPRRINHPEQVWPKGVRQDGRVYVKFYINAEGIPDKISVTKPNLGGLGFEQAAIGTVKQMRFLPARYMDEPVCLWVTQVVRFDAAKSSLMPPILLNKYDSMDRLRIMDEAEPNEIAKVHFFVDKRGEVKNIVVSYVSERGCWLKQTAQKEVEKWKFEPAWYQGKPVGIWASSILQFAHSGQIFFVSPLPLKITLENSPNRSEAARDTLSDLILPGFGNPPPELTNKRSVSYPDSAREAHIVGDAEIELSLSEDGNVNEVKLLKEVPQGWHFGDTALETVRKWRFTSYQKDPRLEGKVWIEFHFKFNNSRPEVDYEPTTCLLMDSSEVRIEYYYPKLK